MMSLSSPADYLIAHRGDRQGGGENTLVGFDAAAKAGARFGECDIQFTSDLVPVVLHDNRLKRLCGRADIKATETPLDALRRACEPSFPLATLADLMAWLAQTESMTMFIELKPPVRKRLTDQSIAKRIAQLLPDTLLPRLILISQSAGLVDACSSGIDCPVGWVAESKRPPANRFDYIFMPWQRADEIKRWQTRKVKVGLYTVNDAAKALKLRQAGADFVETNFFSRMVQEMADG